MSLAPDALLTAPEQSELVALFDMARGKRTAHTAAEAALEQFLRERATTDIGMMFDFFGDGMLKSAALVARPGGRRPGAITAKMIEERKRGARPPATLPAAASAGLRAQAQALHANRQRAQAAYCEAAQAFERKLNRLCRRPLCQKDSCVDVFGDGLMRRVVDIAWPEPLMIRRGRLVA